MENREIKFRALDKFNGCYWYSDKYNNLAEFFTVIQSLIDGGNELIFQQFTGLKDKNGKEIYEGDIVKVKGTKRIGEYITVVVYKGQGFILKRNDTYYNEFATLAYKVEVVGNIYETPDLLK